MSWAEGQFRESHSLQQKMPLQGPSQQRLLSPSSQWRDILFNRFDFSGECYLSSANASSMSVRVTTYSHSGCAHSHLGSSRHSQEGMLSLAFYFALQDTSATWQKKKIHLKEKGIGYLSFATSLGISTLSTIFLVHKVCPPLNSLPLNSQR